MNNKFYPLSKTEEGIYVACLNETDAYNLSNYLLLDNDIDLDRFKKSIQKVFDNHPYLFTVLSLNEDGNVVKRIEKEDVVINEINKDDTYLVPSLPFKMLDNHLYRLDIIRFENKTYFHFDFHHIICDGFTIKLFIDEVIDIYNGKDGYKEDKTANDFAILEKKALDSDKYQEAKKFYESKLGGVDCDSSIIEDGFYPGDTVKNEYKKIVLPINVNSDDVSKLVKKLKIKTSSFFISLFGLFLCKTNMDDEFLFSTVNNGRRLLGNDDYLKSFGMFVKTFFLYGKIDNDEKIDNYLSRLDIDLANCVNNNLYSYASCVSDLGVNSDIIFAYQGDYMYQTNYKNRSLIAQDRKDGKGKLALELHRINGSFEIWVEYRSDLYEQNTIKTLIRHYQNLLKFVLEHKTSLSLKDVSMMDDDELKILDKYNKVNLDYVDLNRNVLLDFNDIVSKYPDNICVVFKDKQYSYEQVDKITNKLARKLIECGVGQGKIVSSLIRKSEYVVIASLSILKSGAAYQPLDPSYPKERLNFMVEDSSACALIRDDDLDDIIDNFKGKVIKTSEILNLDYSDDKLDINVKNSDLFIMLYTSGTTGKPKGVMLEHINIYSFAKYFAKNFGVDNTSKSAAYASYGFDANLMDLYPHLISGGTVYIIPEEMRLDLVKLGEYFDNVGITHALLTTQVGRQFVEGIDVKTLKYLFVGGEKLVPVENHNNYILYNAYGPSEGTVFCSTEVVDKMYRRVPIGKANDNYKMYVLDKHGNLLPRMVVGELYIAGPQVGRGYLNREKENNEAFLSNKFDNDPLFSRLYKTGDIVRMLENGSIDFIGRKDGQVKIRGFRIELTEVEKVIRSFKGIKDATVKDFTDPNGIKYICAYVVSDKKVDVDKLNDFIKQTKPPYMVPAYTIQLDKIPLNQNSKVDKRALPKPELKEVEIVKPTNETEQKIYDILEKILGHSSFGITTDFYEAGLSSVSSIKFIINLSKAFNVSVENKNILENNTIAMLAKFISNQNEEVISYEKQDSYPITKTQQGIFVESVAKPNSTNYNIPYLFELGDKFDLDRLENAIKMTINNHPYLKMHLLMDDNGNINAQRFDDNPINIKKVKLDKKNLKVEELKEMLIKPFEILGGDLYRIFIISSLDNNYLYLDFHHIVCDGTSEAIILNDISDFYSGKKTELDKDDFEFSGFEVALKEQEDLQSNKYNEAKQYVSSILKDVDGEYAFKKDLKCAEISKLKSIDLDIDFDYEKLNKFVKENNISLNGFFNFAFAFVLSKFIYKKESLYVTIYNGRSSSNYQHVVSMLVKTLPVFIKYDNQDKIVDKLKEMSEELINLQANDLYAFSDIANDFDINSDIMFVYQGDLFTFDNIGGIPVKPILLESDTPKSLFSQEVFLKNNRFVNHFEIDESIYNLSTINSIHRLFELVSNELLEKQFIKDINTLPKEDSILYSKFNDNELEIPDCSFNKLVEKAVENNKDKIAIVGDDVFKDSGNKISITYDTFNKQANKVAWTLYNHNLVREDKVIMMMPRVAQAYIVRQGIIKSSGAFVPVDPKYPLDRIEYIIENSGAKYLITTKSLIDKYKELIDKYNLFAFAIEDIINSDEKDCNLDLDIPSDSLCYIIFTSGSTGKPKGVMINHHNLVNYCLDGNNCLTQEYRDIKEGAIGCSFSSFAFDASLQEECIPLSHGYTAVIASSEEIENPLLLAKTLKEYKVNIMFLTPSFVTNMIEVDEFVEALKGFKCLDMGAESVPVALCERLRSLGITATLNNGYGPTETTITCTMHEIKDKYMTIGKPAINTKLFILDKDDNILPINAIGNLTIGGDLVGRGYLGLEQKTKESFINLTVDGKEIRCYKSGDLARYNNDGNIEFFGRLDNQVKLRGLRVELDEIEKVLNSYPDVSRSVILVKSGSKEGDYLVAYYTGKDNIDKEALTNHMSKSLTPYMVPKVLIQLDKFPLNANGKIDRKALPEPVSNTDKERIINKPTDKLEEDLVEIYSKALGIDEVGIDDDFFELGGTSLSASKVAMLAFKYNLPIVYKDVFDYPSVLALKKMIEAKNGVVSKPKEEKKERVNTNKYYEALKNNLVSNVDDITFSYDYNEYLLTGANGFLGSHILKELIDKGKKINVVVKSGEIDARSKLLGLFAFYFDSPMEEKIDKYVNIIDCDITSKDLVDKTKDLSFDCIINCAAIVKHFASDNSIEIVNVGGVERLIEIALKKNARLIQISTLSVAGENVNNKFEDSYRMREDMLDFGQDISNKYVNSKFKAESLVLDNIINKGLKGKIIRVGNLMGRNSDGEFQANSITNNFMRNLKSYATIGKFPVNSMDSEVDFSPIDEVSRAILKLVRTDDKFTVFHCSNSHLIQMGDVIDCMNKIGFSIDCVSDKEFYETLKEAMADESKNMLVSSLISYSSSEDETRSFILTNNEFTNKALYHLGFKWPITDYNYLKNAIESLLTLGFFDREDL